MLDRQSVFAALPIQKSEVEMRLRIVRPQLDRAQQKLLRFIELALFEKDQTEVGMQDENVWILDRQPAVDDFSLGKRVRFEVDETE